MFRPLRSFVFLVLAVIASPWSHAADTLQVFTDRAHPVVNAGMARIVYLDGPAGIQARMSAGLPNNPDAAKRQILEKTKSPQWQAMQQDLIDAYGGVIAAWKLGVTKVPAVVVDGRYVVYGESDVQRAAAMIAAYRKEARP